MSVPVSYSSDNNRFVRHRFLSLSPTSTTIFQRTFDLLLNKYHQPIRVNEETGEIQEIKPPRFDKHKGFLSDKARRQLSRSVYTLMGLVNENILIDGEHKDMITFATLTLASSQIKSITESGIEYYATDTEIKSKCFNQLMTELRTDKQVDNYVSVCEKQLNGSIHFHILLDQRIDYEWLRIRWNSLQNKFGFVDRYTQRMSQLTKDQYVALRTKEYKKKASKDDLRKIDNAWEFGQKTGWTNPNSTDIESLKGIDNIGAYISKYMSKGYGHTDAEMKAQISKIAGKIEINDLIAKSFYQIEGRIWSCSQTVSKARKCIVEAEDYLIDEIDNLVDKEKNLKVFVEDRFTTVLHNFKHIYIYCNEIFKTYTNHLKAVVHYANSVVDTAIDCCSDSHFLSSVLDKESSSSDLSNPLESIKKVVQTRLNLSYA
jgi:hypothetical protein